MSKITLQKLFIPGYTEKQNCVKYNLSKKCFKNYKIIFSESLNVTYFYWEKKREILKVRV